MEKRHQSRGKREGKRDVYIHKKKNAIPDNEKAKKGIPYLLRPDLPPANLTRRGRGKRGQGDKKIHNEGFSGREKNVKRYSYRKVKCSPFLLNFVPQVSVNLEMHDPDT